MRYEMFKCDSCGVRSEDAKDFMTLKFRDNTGGETRDYEFCKDAQGCFTDLWDKRRETVNTRPYQTALQNLFWPAIAPVPVVGDKTPESDAMDEFYSAVEASRDDGTLPESVAVAYKKWMESDDDVTPV